MTSDGSGTREDRRILVTVLIVAALVAAVAMIVLAAVRIGRVETSTWADARDVIAARAALLDLPVRHPRHVVHANDHGGDTGER